MNLRSINETLIADNLMATFKEATDELPSDRIDVRLPVQGFDEPFTIQLTEIETDPEAMRGVGMYQIFAPIPVTVDEAGLAQVTSALPAINTLTSLGAFSVDPDERFAYLRYVGLVDDDCDPGRVITEALWLTGFTLEHHAATILALAHVDSS